MLMIVCPLCRCRPEGGELCPRCAEAGRAVPVVPAPACARCGSALEPSSAWPGRLCAPCAEAEDRTGSVPCYQPDLPACAECGATATAVHIHRGRARHLCGVCSRRALHRRAEALKYAESKR